MAHDNCPAGLAMTSPVVDLPSGALSHAASPDASATALAAALPLSSPVLALSALEAGRSGSFEDLTNAYSPDVRFFYPAIGAVHRDFADKSLAGFQLGDNTMLGIGDGGGVHIGAIADRRRAF